MFLHVENITLSIGGLEILHDVNFDIEKGEITSIIGPNGAGKTTLFNVITGRISPTRGKVSFKGKEITLFPSFQIAQIGIARSFQINNIFPGMSVFENICIATQAKSPFRYSLLTQVAHDLESPRKAEETLKLIGLQNVKNKLARELSHGDQRRLEIGMSLAIEPELLMLDEPTSGMSPSETAATVNLLESIGKRVTLCIIEHKITLVMNLSQKIIVLNLGKKIAEGSPETIASNETVREIYLGTA
jgi:branched-chain amino acid transport system ATP-binding protein